jgi:cell division protein FtsB
MLLAYHVVAGNNGLTIYKQKLAEDKALAIEVKQLQQDNERLKRHVDHLATDPDAIEFEAHQRLRYMLPGQVTVLDGSAESHTVQK